MRKHALVLLVALVAVVVATPALAQEAGGAAAAGPNWGILGAAFAIGFAAFGGALGQGRAIAAAVTGMARNPGAAGNVRTTLIIGLAFIESLVLYALLIALRGAEFF